MNSAVIPLAEWAPLLFTPDMKPPRFDTWRARNISSVSERMIRLTTPAGMVPSPTTRLPRVRSMFPRALSRGGPPGHWGGLLVGGEVRLEDVELDARVAVDDAGGSYRGGGGRVV